MRRNYHFFQFHKIQSMIIIDMNPIQILYSICELNNLLN